MNRRFAAVLVFALVVSGVASLIVYFCVLTQVQAAGIKPLPTHNLLVASHDLNVGALITDADLRWVKSTSTTPPQAINDSKLAIGRGVVAAIYEGEPLVENRLAPKGAGAGLAALMPRSVETAGSAMFTMVASRMTISTVTAMTARANQRFG